MDAVVYDRMFAENTRALDANPRGLERLDYRPLARLGRSPHSRPGAPGIFPGLMSGAPATRTGFSIAGLPETTKGRPATLAACAKRIRQRIAIR